MKILKSFLLVTVGFCTTTLLHAQALKAEIAKPSQSTAPLQGIDNKTVTAPEIKPQSAIALKMAPASTQKPIVPGGESRPLDKNTTIRQAPAIAAKEEMPKPVAIPVRDMKHTPSTLAVDLKENTAQPIHPAPSISKNKPVVTKQNIQN